MKKELEKLKQLNIIVDDFPSYYIAQKPLMREVLRNLLGATYVFNSLNDSIQLGQEKLKSLCRLVFVCSKDFKVFKIHKDKRLYQILWAVENETILPSSKRAAEVVVFTNGRWFVSENLQCKNLELK